LKNIVRTIEIDMKQQNLEKPRPLNSSKLDVTQVMKEIWSEK